MTGKKGMKNRKDNWTNAENAILVNAIVECTRSGMTMTTAIVKCAELLENRTYEACYRHWAVNIRKDHLQEFNHAKAEALLGRKL